MTKIGGDRNFGWGKQMAWAGKQALRDRFGPGHYGTVASHADRWRSFCGWAREQGIRDARAIDQSLLLSYGHHLAQQVGAETKSVSYAQNQLTSVNVTLEALRGDKQLQVSPAEMVGRRTGVRTAPPAGLDRHLFSKAVQQLHDRGRLRTASVVELCRELGLRRREAALMDLQEAVRQARTLGRVNVTRGTKGGRGRSVDRWVPVSDSAVAALHRALNASSDSRNLVPKGVTLKEWLPRLSREWGHVSKLSGLGTIRDLRAAFACERYQEMTGCPAPAVAASRSADKDDDLCARQAIAHELGHGRVDVIAAYVGSSK
ncbi:MAG: integrase domain-containing protein [Acidiferrobacterales bacterium]